MGYQVKVSLKAKQQLDHIGDFIALDNPHRAESFVDELLDKAYSIGDNPLTYAPLKSHPQFRKKSYKGYIILYTINGDVVNIAHIFNSVRDYTKLLK
jgi:toxin ParE1/3/4